MSQVEDEMQRWASGIQNRVEKEKRICLPTRVRFYLPTRTPDRAFSCGDSIRAMKSKIDKTVGGSTMYWGVGTGEEGGKPKTEPVNVIEAAHCLDAEKAGEIAKAVAQYAIECEQEWISVSDSEFHILPSSAMEGWFIEELRKEKRPTKNNKKRKP